MLLYLAMSKVDMELTAQSVQVNAEYFGVPLPERRFYTSLASAFFAFVRGTSRRQGFACFHLAGFVG